MTQFIDPAHNIGTVGEDEHNGVYPHTDTYTHYLYTHYLPAHTYLYSGIVDSLLS